MDIEGELVEYKNPSPHYGDGDGSNWFFLELGLADVQQIDFKNECLIRTDGTTRSTGTVGEIRWDEEFDFAAFFAELEAFGPAADHAAEWELDGLISFVGAVKLRAIKESATVVDLDGVRGLR